jgi:hypothetical protein
VNYSNAINELVKQGCSAAYIESKLWASFSRNYSIQQIAKDVGAAMLASRASKL